MTCGKMRIFIIIKKNENFITFKVNKQINKRKKGKIFFSEMYKLKMLNIII